MKKRFFVDSIKTISSLIVLVSFVAIIVIGSYTCYVASEAMVSNVAKNAVAKFGSADSVLFEKIKNVNRFVDILNMSDVLGTMLTNDGKDDDVQINSYMNRYSAEFEDIEGCVFVSTSGNEFIYNISGFSTDTMLQLQIGCSGLSDKIGSLKWYNIDHGSDTDPIFEKYAICATTIYSDNPIKTYIFINKKFFEQAIEDNEDDSIIAILDENGRVLASNDLRKFLNSFYSTLNNITSVYSKKEGVFPFELDGENFIGVYSDAEFTNFKFIEIYRKTFFYNEIYKIIAFACAVIIVFLLCIMMLYVWLLKRFIKPFNSFVNVMRNFKDESRKQSICIAGNNEINYLCDGYNDLVKNIDMLIEQIKLVEEEKRKGELLALKYQINPHFLCNTLNSIKILAYNNKQKEIANSIKTLSRLLDKIFTTMEREWKLEDEIGFIKDYVSLLQIRYYGLIDVSYCIEDNIEDCLVPNMIIQPIIENAVGHGLARKLAERTGNPALYISAGIQNDVLVVEVMDNGEGMTSEQIHEVFETPDKELSNITGGIALKNIIARIGHLYGDEYGVSITSKEKVFTSVTVRLPVCREDSLPDKD